MLIRVQRHVIEPPPQTIESYDPVDRVVLDTRAVGTSHTKGTMRVMLDEQSTTPTLLICFDGATCSSTVGQNGPAMIRSRTATNFRCMRQVTFTLEEGFQGAPAQVTTGTHLLVDSVTPDRPGLRGRIVQRVAWRRTNESHAQAQATIDRATQLDLKQEFEKSVDEYLSDLNRQLEAARRIARLSGSEAKLRLQVVGDDRQSIALYLAPEGCRAELPELDEPRASAEVWIKRPAFSEAATVFGNRTTNSLAAMVGSQIPALGGVLSGPLVALSASSADEGGAYRCVGQWTVIGLDPQNPKSAGGGASQDVVHRSRDGKTTREITPAVLTQTQP
jgi:hypothetical protein